MSYHLKPIQNSKILDAVAYARSLSDTYLTFLPQHITDDWITVASGRLPEVHHNINSLAIRESMFNINYYGVLKDANFGADLIKHKIDWAKFKDNHRKYGVSEHDIDIRYYQLIPVSRCDDINAVDRAVLNNTFYVSDIELQHRNLFLTSPVQAPDPARPQLDFELR